MKDGRIRVLFVQSKRQPPLGADTWIHLQILRDLDRSRIEVHAACAAGPVDRPTPTYQALREISDVEIVKVDLGSELAGVSFGSRLRAGLSLVPAAWSVMRLVRYVRKHEIELVHTTDRPRDAAVCVLLGRVTRAKCIIHAHVGFDPAWMREMLQHSIHKADALIAISEFVAGTLREGGCDPGSIYVVRNGIELARWQPKRGREATREKLAIAETTPVVLTVCRLFPAKGVSDLVGAIHDLRAEVPTAVLLVVGGEMDADYLSELRALVSVQGLNDRVHFLGRRDDIPDLMAAADVFAMPSHYEPFGLVYAEAMAMALPVVALDNGGTPEVVEHGVTGLLSPAGDRVALAANLRSLLLDPERRAVYGSNGRERVERLFTTRRMADETADVYQAVARDAPSGDAAGRSGNVPTK